MSNLTDAQEAKIKECREYMHTALNVGLSVLTTVFPSYVTLFYGRVSDQLSNDISLADVLGNVPVGYFLIDSYGSKINLDHSQLRTIRATLLQLEWVCVSTFSQHYLDIMALTTVEDVIAYDATQGFPTAPWVLQI